LEKHGIKIKSNIGAMSFNSKQHWLAEHKDKLDEIVPSKKELITSVKALMRPVLSSVLQSAGKVQVESMAKENAEFNLDDPRVVKWLGDRLEATSTTTAETTIDAVKTKLRTDFENGEPLLKMSEHLRDYFTGAETWRANEVARTEATAATGRGQLEAVYQMDPTLGKGWLIEDDPHTRETHRAAGERYSDPIALDDDFEVGQDKMQSPGTGDSAEENCNCRCGIVFMPMEEK
jgi:regulator of replication initiation timing